MRNTAFFLMIICGLAGFGQEKASAFFQALDSNASKTEFNSGGYYDALYQSQVAMAKMKRDSIHRVKLAQLKLDRTVYQNRCKRNNRRYLWELETLDKLCGADTFSCADLYTIDFKFIAITIEGDDYCGFRLPSSDSTKSKYAFTNLDTLCLPKPVDVSGYKGIAKAMQQGKISRIIWAGGGTSVDSFPEVPRVAGIFPPEENRDEAFYEEHAAVLAVRLKTLLTKSRQQFPDQAFPTFQDYLNHEQAADRNFKELATYRQAALTYFTEKLNKLHP